MRRGMAPQSGQGSREILSLFPEGEGGRKSQPASMSHFEVGPADIEAKHRGGHGNSITFGIARRRLRFRCRHLLLVRLGVTCRRDRGFIGLRREWRRGWI